MTTEDFELGVALLLSPETCQKVPDEPLTVSGLGPGLVVAATLASDIAESPRMTLFVNDVARGTTSSVGNGDTVQIEVCTPASYAAEEHFTLHYGNHDDAVTVRSHHAPPPPPPPSPPPPSPSPPPARYSFDMVVGLNGYTTATFDAAEQAKFVEGIAALGGFETTRVQVTSVTTGVPGLGETVGWEHNHATSSHPPVLGEHIVVLRMI